MKKRPEAIFYRGDLSLLEKAKVSIVGSRRPSQYTLKMAAETARKLSSAGVVVVSGAALGVDATAHRAAGSDATIAVMANGLDISYPAINRGLIGNIEEKGLLLSMYEDETPQTNWRFVARNEMVVALGDVLIVAEAERDSGSMRSAEFAQKMGKKIYTFPHRMGESEGIMDLVKSGEAEIIYDIDRFVTQYGRIKVCEEDPFLAFCIQNPSYEKVLREYGERVSLYELDGKIAIENGQIRVL